MPEECPACGSELDRREDELGVTFQCTELDCLQFYDEDEIVNLLATPPVKEAADNPRQ